MSLKLQILPVSKGDCFFLILPSYIIMIDAGTKRSYIKADLKNKFNNLEKIDLLILTHTDEDHIGGILKYYSDTSSKKDLIKKVWFNSGKLINDKLILNDENPPYVQITENTNLKVSLKQAISLEKKIEEDSLVLDTLIKSGDKYTFDFGNFLILSPDIEDLKLFYNSWEIEKSKIIKVSRSRDYDKTIDELKNLPYEELGTIPNKSSIAFIYNYNNFNILFMGDAFSSIIKNNIEKYTDYNKSNKLKLDFVKVSHHGGNYSINYDLLEIINCTNYIISTDGSNGLPTKESLCKIVTHREDKIKLYFNYKNNNTQNIFFDEEFEKYNFEIIYLSKQDEYTIDLEKLF
jgi:beta-lactamase superfamily II metal-dependent hydrolase